MKTGAISGECIQGHDDRYETVTWVRRFPPEGAGARATVSINRFLARDATETLYAATFEAPEEEWEDAKTIGQSLLAMLCVDVQDLK